LGFATKTKVTAEAVAELYIENSNFKTMTEKKKKEKSKGRKLLEAMAEFVGVDITTLKEVEVNAELVLQDSTGTEIVFPDLDSGGTPVVGDAATIDGAAVPDGSYVMPSLEDATVVFVDGKISEIIPKEDAEVVAEGKDKKKEKKTEVNAEEIQEVSVWSVTVTNTSFELGEVVMYDYDGESYPVSAGEFQLKDGRRIVTDASGTIVNVKDVDEVATEVTQVDNAETQASFDKLKKEMSKKLKAEIEASLKADYEKTVSEKEAEIVALKKKIGSKEFSAEQIEPEGHKKPELSAQANVLLTRSKKQ
jgi:hypothetical protein